MLSYENGQFLVNGNLLGTSDPAFAMAFGGFVGGLVLLAIILASLSGGFGRVIWAFLFNDSKESITQDGEFVFHRGFVTKALKSFGQAVMDVLGLAWAATVYVAKGIGYAILAVATIVLALVIGLVASVLIPVILVIAAIIMAGTYIGMAITWGLNKTLTAAKSVWNWGVEKKNAVVDFGRTQKDRFINWWNTPAVEEEVEVAVESSGYTWYQRLAAHILEMDRDLRNQNRNENADRLIAAVEDNNMDIHDLAAAYTDLTSAVINSDSAYDDSVNGLFAAMGNDDGDNVPLDSVENTIPSVVGQYDEIPVGLPVATGPASQDETVEMAPKFVDPTDCPEVGGAVFVEVVSQEAVEMIATIGTLEELVLRATDSMKIEEDLAVQGNRRREVMEMTRAQLRAECKLLNLAVSGNKDALQERILQAS